MPTARYTADGGAYRVGGHHFEPGDEQEVDTELAEYLADVDDFEVIDAGGDAENFVFTFPDGQSVADLTVTELTDRLDDLPADALEDVRRAEATGQNRSTALDAIDDELEG